MTVGDVAHWWGSSTLVVSPGEVRGELPSVAPVPSCQHTADALPREVSPCDDEVGVHVGVGRPDHGRDRRHPETQRISQPVPVSATYHQ
eukprot:CAMPEP_0202813682 /NCGR_PEP_ID=MMETSP1389-20130828/4979_1 /ASSEMBLY_ACC=CAM_ASM_000865 /TAXON_ID=302021 /ORGANISM="Rhodomonas sp., Strain CCMP768" /LENGTH=88 /DNA_ID=CAMNT_0049485309 /DNA_START=121 /DNA_END=384 /DNA_ORIENTATION=+